jgi:Spy/CpxP family protein refolding chaperone
MEHGQMMGGQHRGGHEFILGMREELELTDEQVERLRSLKSDTERQMIQARADLEIAQIELHDLFSQETVDVSGVDAKIDQIGRLQTAMHKAHVHATLDAEAVLTPEQREKHRQHMRSRGMQERHTRGSGMEKNEP